MNRRTPWLRLLCLSCLLPLAASSVAPPAARASIYTVSIWPPYEEGAAPLTVNFHTDAYDDIDGQVYHSWYFGDGNWYSAGWRDGGFDYASSASHTYTTPGYYTVYVTVCNNANECKYADASVWVYEP